MKGVSEDRWKASAAPYIVRWYLPRVYSDIGWWCCFLPYLVSARWFILVCRFYCCLSIKGNIKRRAAWPMCIARRRYFSVCAAALGDHGAFGCFFCLHFVCVISDAAATVTFPASRPIWYGDFCGKTECVGNVCVCGIRPALIYISHRIATKSGQSRIISPSTGENHFFYSLEYIMKRQGKEKERIPRRELWVTAVVALDDMREKKRRCLADDIIILDCFPLAIKLLITNAHFDYRLTYSRIWTGSINFLQHLQ